MSKQALVLLKPRYRHWTVVCHEAKSKNSIHFVLIFNQILISIKKKIQYFATEYHLLTSSCIFCIKLVRLVTQGLGVKYEGQGQDREGELLAWERKIRKIFFQNISSILILMFCSHWCPSRLTLMVNIKIFDVLVKNILQYPCLQHR